MEHLWSVGGHRDGTVLRSGNWGARNGGHGGPIDEIGGLLQNDVDVRAAEIEVEVEGKTTYVTRKEAAQQHGLMKAFHVFAKLDAPDVRSFL